MKQLLRTISRRVGLAIALTSFVIAGGLALLAAPRHAPPAQAGRVVYVAPASTATLRPLATSTPKRSTQDAPTPTPVPTDTPTPAPTNTPVPTATPAPGWHLVGDYSGTGLALDFATVTMPPMPNCAPVCPDAVRIDWTCQTTPNLPQWQIGFEVPSEAGFATDCKPTQLSGSKSFGLPAGTWSLNMDGLCSGSSCPSMGPWTAAIYSWY